MIKFSEWIRDRYERIMTSFLKEKYLLKTNTFITATEDFFITKRYPRVLSGKS
jgi:hypothetical protein